MVALEFIIRKEWVKSAANRLKVKSTMIFVMELEKRRTTLLLLPRRRISSSESSKVSSLPHQS